MCILLYILLKVVSYYDLNVLSISVMGFQKKVWMGVGGWGEFYPSLFFIFLFFLTLHRPLLQNMHHLLAPCGQLSYLQVMDTLQTLFTSCCAINLNINIIDSFNHDC